MMMLHEWYREKLSRRRRALEENVRVAEETIARFQVERAAQQAWNERRIAAAQNGEHFDEPMPNGHPLDVVAQLEQERAAANAWYERRIAAARQGEPFDEPPPNGANGT